MQMTVDASPAFRQFFPLIPRALARELIVEQGIGAHEPKEVANSLPAAAAFLRGVAAEHDIDQGLVDRMVQKMGEPFDPRDVDDAFVEDVCRTLAFLWLKALDETRDLVDDPNPIALTDRLLPDAASIRGEEDVGELVQAASGTIESMYAMLSADRVWRLYDAFVEVVRSATGATDRLDVSSTTALVIAHGCFSLERRAD